MGAASQLCGHFHREGAGCPTDALASAPAASTATDLIVQDLSNGSCYRGNSLLALMLLSTPLLPPLLLLLLFFSLWS
jgi:hypothetical protein